MIPSFSCSAVCTPARRLCVASALALVGLMAGAQATAAEPADWKSRLTQAAERIDASMPGELGVHVQRLGEAGAFQRGADRRWYLSSTVKVPVAIAVLEQVDAGKLQLEEQLTLNATDIVDGAGDLKSQSPGSRYTIAQLLGRSLEDSDSTATDMLIRRIGEDHLNARVRAWSGGGFGPITTILQVRYDVYGPLHPGVAKLSNADITALRAAPAGEPRLQALARALGVPRQQLGPGTMEDAFETYYAGGSNTATLAAFAKVLEKLVAGNLLSDTSTQRVLGHMRRINTGDRRILAGLPEDVDFAQKTGTQVRRACNLGAIEADRGEAGAVIVVACAQRFDALSEAEQAFSSLGRAIVASGVLSASPRTAQAGD